MEFIEEEEEEVPKYPEDEDDYTFPDGAERVVDLERIKLLGRGVSGCVISVELDPLVSNERYEGMNPIAIKYTVPTTTDPIRDSETEHLISIQIQRIESRFEYEGILLSPKIFRVFKVDKDYVDASWMKFMKKICCDLPDKLKSSTEAKYLYVIETERMDGTLAEISHALERPWSLSEIRAISFQVCEYMSTAQDLLELNHRDLKGDNVLMSELAPEERSSATGYPWKKADGSGPKEGPFSYVVKVADYGLSTTKSNTPSTDFLKRGELFYPVLPVDWMFVAESDSDWTLPGEEVSMADDIWSFGLLLLNTFMQNHDFYRFLPMDPKKRQLLEHKHPIWLQRDHYAPYQYGVIHQVVERHQPFMIQVANLMMKNWSLFGTKAVRKHVYTKMVVLISVCQIQHFLGNGFLPQRTSFTSETANFLYEILDDAELQRQLLRSAQVDPNDPGTNVFQFMVLKFGAETATSSYSGLLFLQKCLSWDKSARNSFGSTATRLERFGAALEDPFLSYRDSPPPEKVPRGKEEKEVPGGHEGKEEEDSPRPLRIKRFIS